MMKEGRTSINVSEELKKEIAKLGKFGESYEDVIWRLIKRWKENTE